MFETSQPIREDPETGLRDLAALRAQSNTAHARLVMEVWEHVAYRIFDPASDHLTERVAFADIATLLGISRASVKAMVDTVQGIGALPGLQDAFTTGELDYAKVRTIVSVLALGASGETCTLMAHRILADARHLTPGPLRAAVWAAWMATDTREAQRARTHLRTYGRKVYVRQGTDSMCWLSACLTDLEGAQAQILIDELATSVCDHDPRTLDARRADALLALLHGDGFLRCQCDNPTCPLATAAPPKRRAYLLQILVDIETLLGLTADPATLPDGTPIDPDVVRTLAEDATWRAILTEMHTIATSTRGGGGDGGGCPTPDADPAGEPTPTPEAGTAAESAPTTEIEPIDTAPGFPQPTSETETVPATDPEPQHESPVPERAVPATEPEPATVNEPPAQLSAPTTVPPDGGVPPSPPPRHCPVFVGIGRRHRPAILPPATGARCTTPARPAPGGGELADELAARALLSGIPEPDSDDGHGGMHTPPPGALTYRPSAAAAALVRAAHPHCVFPGCRIPSHRCELDHVVAFDHTNPQRGGWTIPENLRPLCKGDHQLKTFGHWTPTLVAGGIAWRSRTGLLRFTATTHCRTAGLPPEPAPEPDTTPGAVDANPPLDEAESEALLYEPTWYETHIGENAPAPPPHDTELRERYRQHRAIHTQREQRRPPPF